MFEQARWNSAGWIVYTCAQQLRNPSWKIEGESVPWKTILRRPADDYVPRRCLQGLHLELRMFFALHVFYRDVKGLQLDQDPWSYAFLCGPHHCALAGLDSGSIRCCSMLLCQADEASAWTTDPAPELLKVLLPRLILWYESSCISCSANAT